MASPSTKVWTSLPWPGCSGVRFHHRESARWIARALKESRGHSELVELRCGTGRPVLSSSTDADGIGWRPDDCTLEVRNEGGDVLASWPIMSKCTMKHGTRACLEMVGDLRLP